MGSRQRVLAPWAVLLLALQLAAGASHVIHRNLEATASPPAPAVPASTVRPLLRTGYHFQPPRNWTKGTTAAAPFCGSAGCCCSVEDEKKLREAFLAEVKAHGYHDAGCRSELKAYICAVCTNTTAAINTSSALPLRCAGAAAPSISTRRDLDTAVGGGGRYPSTPLCVHKASTQAYDGVVPLKDGSGRLLCWRRNGQIWLATVDVDPTGGSVLRAGGKPWIDLGSRVSQDAARGRGLAGVAVHSSTGQLFVSYYTNTVGPDGVRAFLVVDQLSASSWGEQHEVR